MLRSRDHDQKLAEYISDLDRVSAQVADAARRARTHPPGVSCNGCSHYARDTINPEAGLGRCTLGHGFHYPDVRHRCADHQDANA